MKRAPAIVCSLVLATLALPCFADAVVTVCDGDVDQGPQTSLADAVQGGGTITFQCPPQTVIAVTRAHRPPPYTILDGGNNVTLDAGARQLTMFSVGNGPLTLRHIRLTRGRSVVPGIGKAPPSLVNVRELYLTDVQIDASQTPVVVQGAARIEDSRFLNNTTALSIGGHGTVMRSVFAGNDRALNIDVGRVVGSRFERNRSGALHVGNSKGLVEIVDCTFVGNAPRGALQLGQRSARDVQGIVRVKNSTFRENRHEAGGGAITLVDLAEQAAAQGLPASIVRAHRNLPPASFELAHDHFIDNSGALAGAIHANLANSTGMKIRGGIFAGNVSAGDGGALAWSGRSLEITHSVFRGNRAGARGGALRGSSPAPGAAWAIANSVVVQNESTATSGAIDTPRALINNVTIADNIGWGVVMDAGASTAAQVANTILSQNSSGNCRGVATAALHAGNVQFGAGDCADAASFDPYLDSIYMPALGSEALYAGHVPTCQVAPVSAVDLLFRPRNHADRCASGAYELPALRPATRQAVLEHGPRDDKPPACPCEERPDDGGGGPDDE